MATSAKLNRDTSRDLAVIGVERPAPEQRLCRPARQRTGPRRGSAVPTPRLRGFWSRTTRSRDSSTAHRCNCRCSPNKEASMTRSRPGHHRVRRRVVRAHSVRKSGLRTRSELRRRWLLGERSTPAQSAGAKMKNKVDNTHEPHPSHTGPADPQHESGAVLVAGAAPIVHTRVTPSPSLAACSASRSQVRFAAGGHN
jgi:hypothetical protein